MSSAADGSAMPGDDFEELADEVSFPAGTPTVTVKVSPLDRVVESSDGIFSLTIVGGTDSVDSPSPAAKKP